MHPITMRTAMAISCVVHRASRVLHGKRERTGGIISPMRPPMHVAYTAHVTRPVQRAAQGIGETSPPSSPKAATAPIAMTVIRPQ